MEWLTLVATLGGAVIAIAGTVLADRLRTRQEQGRGLGALRREVYIDFISAAGTAHTRLRELAQDPDPSLDREAESRAALADARIYEVRERLFIDAAAPVAGAGQAMFEQLRALRRAVAAGALLSQPRFHDVYHPYIASVWDYRVAVRDELEGRSLSPGVFGWTDWDGRERCSLCRTEGKAGAAGTEQRRFSSSA
ncbi:CchlQ [Streptomyces sp. NPDC093546]|uniref:CchlQ n=1 Tax=Streptomyces sp. NPDC093546 TaxID=3366040 RepID=UPI003818352C